MLHHLRSVIIALPACAVEMYYNYQVTPSVGILEISICFNSNLVWVKIDVNIHIFNIKHEYKIYQEILYLY